MHLPLTFLGDQSISILQLGKTLPDDLGDVDATPATELDISTAYSEKRGFAGHAARVSLEHRECFDDGFIAEASRIEQAPIEASRVDMPSAAHCSDGRPSASIGRQGACSDHGGVIAARPWATLIFD